MAELKTKLNDASVLDFINAVENEQRKSDAFLVLEMMKFFIILNFNNENSTIRLRKNG